MTTKQIYEWLCSAPMLAGEKLNLDYLPTYDGWSMTMPRRRTDTDILGNAWESVEINITRRKSISGNEDRLAIADDLDKLRFWAKQNPPDGCKVILAGIAKPKSKSCSGITSNGKTGQIILSVSSLPQYGHTSGTVSDLNVLPHPSFCGLHKKV